jgi:hypothetical protein
MNPKVKYTQSKAHAPLYYFFRDIGYTYDHSMQLSLEKSHKEAICFPPVNTINDVIFYVTNYVDTSKNLDNYADAT